MPLGVSHSYSKEAHNRAGKKYSQNLRKAVIAFLGGKCIKCGFSDERALQIDHVYGGGRKDRVGLSSSAFYKKVLADTAGKYQLLCSNCNWIKRVENDEEGGR